MDSHQINIAEEKMIMRWMWAAVAWAYLVIGWQSAKAMSKAHLFGWDHGDLLIIRLFFPLSHMTAQSAAYATWVGWVRRHRTAYRVIMTIGWPIKVFGCLGTHLLLIAVGVLRMRDLAWLLEPSTLVRDLLRLGRGVASVAVRTFVAVYRRYHVWRVARLLRRVSREEMRELASSESVMATNIAWPSECNEEKVEEPSSVTQRIFVLRAPSTN